MGFHFLLQGIFPIQEIKPVPSALADGFFTIEPPRKPCVSPCKCLNFTQADCSPLAHCSWTLRHGCQRSLFWVVREVILLFSSTCTVSPLTHLTSVVKSGSNLTLVHMALQLPPSRGFSRSSSPHSLRSHLDLHPRALSPVLEALHNTC